MASAVIFICPKTEKQCKLRPITRYHANAESEDSHFTHRPFVFVWVHRFLFFWPDAENRSSTAHRNRKRFGRAGSQGTGQWWTNHINRARHVCVSMAWPGSSVAGVPPRSGQSAPHGRSDQSDQIGSRTTRASQCRGLYEPA